MLSKSIRYKKYKHKIPMLIFTCRRDDNYRPCLRAYEFFQVQDCNACLILVDHHRHEFAAIMPQLLYDWIVPTWEIAAEEENTMLAKRWFLTLISIFNIRKNEHLAPEIKSKFKIKPFLYFIIAHFNRCAWYLLITLMSHKASNV